MPTTSEPDAVFVWTWLPGSTEPVVAGQIRARGDLLTFGYGSSYLGRRDAISLYSPELPLRPGTIEPLPGLILAGALRDGSPDTWGRRVIDARLSVEEGVLSERQYMLASGSNRLGAIDFQASAETYEPRTDGATLDELHRAAEILQEGESLSPAMAEALVHGTTIGGARPKILITDDDGVEWIAKLSASSDKVFSVPNAEATSLELARRAGLEVPDFQAVSSLGREVLLVRRFDRDPAGHRHHVVSALTMSGEHENAGRYVTYPALLDILRQHGVSDADPGRVLFERIAFNIAISNSDDHARNHAAFWDGSRLRLTPAYDLAPGPRSGETASQAMAYGRDGEKSSTYVDLVAQAAVYDLSRAEAVEIVERIVGVVDAEFSEAADIGRLSTADRDRMRGRQFLNPGALHGFGTA